MKLFLFYLIVFFTIVGCLNSTTPSTQDYVLNIENDEDLNIHSIIVEISYDGTQYTNQTESFSSYDDDFDLKDNPIVLTFPIQASKNSETTVSYTCYSYGIAVAEYKRVINNYKTLEAKNEETIHDDVIEILSDESIRSSLKKENIKSLTELDSETLAELFDADQLVEITSFINKERIAELSSSSEEEIEESSIEESSNETEYSSFLPSSDSEIKEDEDSSSEALDSSDLSELSSSSFKNPTSTSSSSLIDPNEHSSSSQVTHKYTITINSGITTSSIEIEEGEKQTISQSPEPSPGYLFKEWESGSHCTVTSPKSEIDAQIECDDDETIDAIFTPIIYSISVKKSGTCGSITTNSIEFTTGDTPIDLGITTDDYCNYSLETEQLNLSGNKITGIDDAHKRSTELEITIIFTESEIPSATISFICQVNGDDFNDCPSVSDNLSSIQLKENTPTATKTMTAKAGYIFDQMVAKENVLVSGNTITFDGPGQGSVYVNFTRKTYNAKIKSSPSSIFTQENHNVGYRVREQHTAPADPFGYTFDKWEGSGDCVVESTQGRIATYYCDGEGQVTAVYEELTSGNYIDTRDDNRTFTWVKHEELFLFTTNLNYAHTWCYKSVDNNCITYGGQYSPLNAQDICPDPWRLPTKLELQNLTINYFINLPSSAFGGITFHSNSQGGSSSSNLGEKNVFWTSSQGIDGPDSYYYAEYTKSDKSLIFTSFDRNSGTGKSLSVKCVREDD
ncbi:MAG: hypothetical protein OCC49_01605 [Fibrobacterales bacterium]